MKRYLPGLLLALALTAPVRADGPDLNQLLEVRTHSGAGTVSLEFVAQRPPVYAVYTRRNPDQLVVELIDTETGDAIRRGSQPRGTTKWQVQADNLTRVQAVVGLPHRVPEEAVQVKVVGNSLKVDFPLEYTSEETVALSPGIRWLRREQVSGGSYLLFNELRFDPKDPKVRVDVGLAKDRLDSREKPSSMAARAGAIAAINGGYFASAGGPLGVVVKDGKVLSPHVGRRPPRTVVGVMSDGAIAFEQMVAKAGKLTSRSGTTWSDVQLALGGGPRLLHRGKVALTTDAEELGPRGNDITRVAARTAVATTRDGKMMLVTATGYRDNHLQGLKLEPLAALLLRQGASEAMNLDGGASTVMAIGSHVVSNGPGAPNMEKAVATTLMVSDQRGPNYPDSLTVRPGQVTLTADGTSQTELTIEVKDPQGRAVPDGTPVHLFLDRLATESYTLKTRGGQARAQVKSMRSTGPAEVRVECGPATGTARIELNSGPPAVLLTRLTPGLAVTSPEADAPAQTPTPDASTPDTPNPAPSPEPPPAPLPTPAAVDTQQLALTVQINDAYGNPAAGQSVQFLSEAGEVLYTGLSGRDGKSSALLKLPAAGARVQVVAAPLAPVTVQVPALQP